MKSGCLLAMLLPGIRFCPLYNSIPEGRAQLCETSCLGFWSVLSHSYPSLWHTTYTQEGSPGPILGGGVPETEKLKSLHTHSRV